MSSECETHGGIDVFSKKLAEEIQSTQIQISKNLKYIKLKKKI
jgi:hypothetical protein